MKEFKRRTEIDFNPTNYKPKDPLRGLKFLINPVQVQAPGLNADEYLLKRFDRMYAAKLRREARNAKRAKCKK